MEGDAAGAAPTSGALDPAGQELLAHQRHVEWRGGLVQPKVYGISLHCDVRGGSHCGAGT